MVNQPIGDEIALIDNEQLLNVARSLARSYSVDTPRHVSGHAYVPAGSVAREATAVSKRLQHFDRFANPLPESWWRIAVVLRVLLRLDQALIEGTVDIHINRCINLANIPYETPALAVNFLLTMPLAFHEHWDGVHQPFVHHV